MRSPPDIVPLPIIVHCPACKLQHIDEPPWDKDPHKTHLCNYCGKLFRVANIATVGVKALL